MGIIKRAITVNLAPHWPAIRERAEWLHQLMKNHPNHKNLVATGHPDVVGTAGEWTFGLLTDRTPRSEPSYQGDRGRDFVDPDGRIIDVKATALAFCPVSLAVNPLQLAVSEADLFALVVVHLEKQVGAYVGWCWRSRVASAPLRRLQPKGDRLHVVPECELDPRLFAIGGPRGREPA